MKKRSLHFLALMVSFVIAFTLILGACDFGGITHTTHVDSDNDGKCDECGEAMTPAAPHTHTFSEAWEKSETEHWHKATCEHESEVSEKAAHTFVGDTCSVCGYTRTPEPHTHAFSEAWEKSETEHWHKAICGHDEEVSEKAAHTFDGDTCSVCGFTREKAFSVNYRTGYAPKKFSEVTNEITELADGVHLVANKMKLSDGKISVVYTIEVDLNKAGIVAGTKNNATDTFSFEKTTPYAMAQAWEQATGGQVYASINADFFGSVCVNAFVKDGIIIKDGHNDNSNYDYKAAASDVPASAPMLFGVKGNTAQIAPIVSVDGNPTDPAVKEQFIKAKLSYAISDGSKLFSVIKDGNFSDEYISYYTKTTNTTLRKGVAVKVDTSKGVADLEVLEVKKVTASTKFKCEANGGYAYLIVNSVSNEMYNYLNGLKAGDKISFSVTSPDGAWNGFDTILGCRQALVIDDAVTSTVTLENTNGAQNRDIPRTAVGIKPDGTVVLFAVESLWYGGKGKGNDTHGMNLPELAEFAYYYGCNVAANFDGGGSTQLTVRGEGETAPRVLIRSSDTGVADVAKTRVVMNGFLITSKKEN